MADTSALATASSPTRKGASRGPRAGVGVLDVTFLDIHSDEELSKATEEVMRSEAGQHADKYKAIRLGNNRIEYIAMIAPVVGALSFDLSNILWLDLSFNSIKTIPDCLSTQFPNLKTLYLHANKISKLKEVRKLQACSNLRSITMYGNPVEENKHYKLMLIFCCPNAHQIDFSTVTARQKGMVESWSLVHRKKLYPDEEDN